MKKMQGVTLSELMVVVSIVAILAMSSTPMINSIIVRNRITSHTNEFITALNRARSEAVKRKARVVLCTSNNGNDCVGSWTDGWIVFVDSNKDGAVGADEDILLSHEQLSGGNTLIGDANVNNYVAYMPNGSVRANGVVQGGILTFGLCDKFAFVPDESNQNICHPQKGCKNQITIDLTGRAKKQKISC
jgi:type IV fimbrial biogenesis protein FimT